MSLPPIQNFDEISITDPVGLVSTAGFEDRIEAVFDDLENMDGEELVNEGICIKYKPENDRNRVRAIEERVSDVGIEKSDQNWIIFDRYSPDDFVPLFTDALQSLNSEYIILDISGMSKYLITLSLQVLSEYPINVIVYYAEADIYHPTENHFNEKWEDEPEDTPAFLTSDIYDIVTTRTLSSLSKSGQPVIAIAFPGFNYKKMVALASELSPHQLVTIRGIPRLSDDRWRVEAIDDLNREVESYIRTRTESASTFDYQETYDLLNELYEEYADAYRLVLAPTGSKLQTVGASVFRLVHSDIQVVYPAVSGFADDYTEGWKETWAIDFGILDELSENLKSETDERLDRIQEKIKLMNERYNEEELED